MSGGWRLEEPDLEVCNDDGETLAFKFGYPRWVSMQMIDVNGGIARATEIAESFFEFVVKAYTGAPVVVKDYEIFPFGDEFSVWYTLGKA